MELLKRLYGYIKVLITGSVSEVYKKASLKDALNDPKKEIERLTKLLLEDVVDEASKDALQAIEELDIFGGALDQPDERDYPYLEIFGSEGKLPSSVDMSNIKIQNQGINRTPSTKYACASFGVAHATNIHNKNEGSNEYIDGSTHWYGFAGIYESIYRDQYGFDIWTTGSYLQHQLKYAKDKELITGYAKVSSLNEMKHSLANGKVLYTGTSNIDWKKTKTSKGNIAIRGAGYGHAYIITGYNDKTKLLKCMNSYGPSYMNEGHFYIKYEDIDVLFSTYSLVDKKEVKKIEERKVIRDGLLQQAKLKNYLGKKLSVKEEIATRNNPL